MKRVKKLVANLRKDKKSMQDFIEINARYIKINFYLNDIRQNNFSSEK